MKKYACIQKTLDEFRNLYTTSLKDNNINENEYQRFVKMYENYLTNIVTTTPVDENKPNSFL